MHSVKRILTTENRTCAIRPTAIQSDYQTLEYCCKNGPLIA